MVAGGRFDAAIAAFDAIHREDPEQDAAGAPRELLYAQRMSAWLEKLAPGAPEALRLAARCQHLRRWSLARSAYPEGKVGYLRWRKESAAAHAVVAGEVLEKAGYDAPAIAKVQALVRKENLKRDPDTQLLEDAGCLVFLEHYFGDFARKHDEAKLVDILRKTWRKMSPQGQAAALALRLPAPLEALVGKALSK